METIKKQFEALKRSNTVPVLEYPIQLDIESSDKDWLVVDIIATDEGVKFSFDDHNLPVAFDGDVEVTSDNCFLVPFDS